MCIDCSLFEIVCMDGLMMVWWPKLVASKVNKLFVCLTETNPLIVVFHIKSYGSIVSVLRVSVVSALQVSGVSVLRFSDVSALYISVVLALHVSQQRISITLCRPTQISTLTWGQSLMITIYEFQNSETDWHFKNRQSKHGSSPEAILHSSDDQYIPDYRPSKHKWFISRKSMISFKTFCVQRQRRIYFF
jgi:hypothetical protein